MNKTEFDIIKSNNLSKKMIIFGVFLFFAAFFTNITFIFVFYFDYCTNYYINHIDAFKNSFGSYVTPSRGSIINYIWPAFSFLILGTLLFAFSPLLLKYRVKLSRIIMYISLIVILFFLSSTLFAVAEYNYSRFTILLDFVVNKDNKDLSWSNSIKTNIDKLIEINNNHKHFGWTTSKSAWWFSFFRISVIMIFFAKIFFSLGTLNIEDKKIIEKIERKSASKRFGKSRVVNFFNRIVNNSQKNLSMWIIITTIIIAAPQIIYLIVLSYDGSSLSNLLILNHIAPALLKPFIKPGNVYDVFLKKSAGTETSYFQINQIQMIFLGAVFAFLVLFSMYYIREWEIKFRIIIVQAIVLFVFLSILIFLGFTSMIRMSQIYDEWQDKYSYSFQNLINDPKNKELIAIFNNLFPNSNKDNLIKDYGWPSGIELFSLIVISIGIWITTLILFVDMFVKYSADIKKSAKTLYFEEDNWYL